jgi:hypothetical protein
MIRPSSNLCLIIDLAGKSRAPTSVAQAKLFVEILGNHYPERLGTAVILNLPWMVKKFLDMIFKFVDPVTKAKVSVRTRGGGCVVWVR